MSHNENNINGLRRMLREIADLAENASLTGSLWSGAPKAARRFNAILSQLENSNAVPKGMFEQLDVESTDYGQLGVDARLLASYLKGSDSESTLGNGDASVLVRLAPFIRGEDLALLVRQQVAKGGQISNRVISGLAPFLGSDELGKLVREHMLSDMGTKEADSEAVAPTPPQPPSPPSGETLQDLAAQLRRPELSREDRDRIAARLAELASQL